MAKYSWTASGQGRDTGNTTHGTVEARDDIPEAAVSSKVREHLIVNGADPGWIELTEKK